MLLLFIKHVVLLLLTSLSLLCIGFAPNHKSEHDFIVVGFSLRFCVYKRVRPTLNKRRSTQVCTASVERERISWEIAITQLGAHCKFAREEQANGRVKRNGNGRPF